MLVGLDVGGTHIDAIIIKDKKIIKIIKVPYNINSLDNSIINTLDKLFHDIDVSNIKQINLSTTISTNAIATNNISNVGLIIQSGPGLSNNFLKVTNNDFFISGYTDHRGVVVKDLNLEEIEQAKASFKEKNIEAIAIATKFSTRNPLTEQLIKEHFINDYEVVSLSHNLSGRLNFPRRINTTYLNASIEKTYKTFINSVISSLNEKNILAPIYILKADGGIISLKESLKRPIETIFSGPAASLMGFLGLLDIKEDAILLDIGGTTTDIFILADGISLFEPLGIEINNYKTLVRSIFSKSIALGGDSAIRILNNTLEIGPERLDKPICLGGKYPTPTDAFVNLNLLKIGDYNKASKALEELGNKLNITKDEVATQILEKFTSTIYKKVNKTLSIINNKPVYTIKELLENKLITPKSLHLIGGPAKALSKNLQKEFNIPTSFPKDYFVTNAIGAALSKSTGEINLYLDTTTKVLIVPELQINKKINRNISLNEARELALKYLKELIDNQNISISDNHLEIVEESSFNKIDGFYTTGKNIRIKAQVKPGLTYHLGGPVKHV